MIFSHSGDPELRVGGRVGPHWVWGQDVGPAGLLDTVTRWDLLLLLRGPKVQQLLSLFSWAAQFSQKRIFQSPTWNVAAGPWDLRAQTGELHVVALISVCVFLSHPLGLVTWTSWSVWSVSAKKRLPVSYKREGRRADSHWPNVLCPSCSPTSWRCWHLLQPPGPGQASSIYCALSSKQLLTSLIFVLVNLHLFYFLIKLLKWSLEREESYT